MNEEFNFRTGRNCVFKNIINLVFVTKYRRGVFDREMLDRLEEIFKETCTQMNSELLEFNGEDDHVHLLVSCSPTVAASNLAGKLKGKSSYFLRKEFMEKLVDKLWGSHLWSSSYCIVSCGSATLETVKKYIEDQRSPGKQKDIKRSLHFTGKKRDKNKCWLA